MKTIKTLLFRKGAPRHWPFIVPIALGIGFIALAVLRAEPTIRFVGHATRAEGQYVGAITGKDGQVYHPMFRFTSDDGSVRTFTAQGGPTGTRYKDGDKAPVLYDPSEAKLATFTELWLSPVTIGVPGLMLAIIGTALLITARKRQRHATVIKSER